MSNKLKEVTYLTAKNLKSHEIVLPSKYSKTFGNMAKVLNVDFEKEDVILKDLHHDEDHVNKIVKKTHESLDTLKESTTCAQKAIQERNDESLKQINDELSIMKSQIEFLQKELFSDPLTGAFNRKWFMDQFLNNDKFQSEGYIAFIDLNKFKIINDTYGHMAGDQVLKYLVKFLKAELNIPGVDVVRYAGDEFIVLFDKKKTANLNHEKVMLDTQAKLATQKLKSAKIKELKFGFSFGLCSFTNGSAIEDILEKVDELMYQNKEANR